MRRKRATKTCQRCGRETRSMRARCRSCDLLVCESCVAGVTREAPAGGSVPCVVRYTCRTCEAK